VEELRPAVVHIQGDADECRRRLMGSGFVTAPDYVVTNAHVVAGTQTVRLDTVLGVHEATVVYYNPGVDLAVLHAPGLGLPALPWAGTPAATGDDAIVMGFPESGPFEAAPARIRDELLIAGPDIYASGRVEREAYTVRGSIRQGNSGGPLVDTEGRVLGVVFGASVDQTDTGYVVTADEAQRQIGDVTALAGPVDTQGCVAS
jgi:S1-C subfamily serine protease